MAAIFYYDVETVILALWHNILIRFFKFGDLHGAMGDVREVITGIFVVLYTEVLYDSGGGFIYPPRVGTSLLYSPIYPDLPKMIENHDEYCCRDR
jgi:hypothetical protein